MNGFADDVLQFFDLSAAAIPLPQQDDSISEAISPPEGFRVFGRTYSNLYVCFSVDSVYYGGVGQI